MIAWFEIVETKERKSSMFEFNNIGKLLRQLAIILFLLGSIVSAINGIMINKLYPIVFRYSPVFASDPGIGNKLVLALPGVIIALVGIFLTLVISAILCAFGAIADSNVEIARQQSKENHNLKNISLLLSIHSQQNTTNSQTQYNNKTRT